MFGLDLAKDQLQSQDGSRWKAEGNQINNVEDVDEKLLIAKTHVSTAFSFSTTTLKTNLDSWVLEKCIHIYMLSSSTFSHGL